MPSDAIWPASPERKPRTGPYLRSQIISLRTFSAFRLTADKPEPLKMANSCEKRLSPEARPAGLSRPERRTDPGWGQLSHTLLQGTDVWLTATTTHSRHKVLLEGRHDLIGQVAKSRSVRNAFPRPNGKS